MTVTFIPFFLLRLYDTTDCAGDAPLCFKAMAYGGSVGTVQNTASTARRAEFQQIAARTLDAALSEREPEAFVHLLKEVVKARGGFTAVGRTTGLNRTALYRTLSADGDPRLNTLIVLLPVVGLRLAVEPLDKSDSG